MERCENTGKKGLEAVERLRETGNGDNRERRQ